jgi:hypothetical protein
MEIRKFATCVEETLIEGGRELTIPTQKAAALAVIKNPFAGKYQENLSELTNIGEELGRILGKKAVEALGKPVESYGKGAIVGMDGELEHAGALLHPKLGKPFREAVGGGKAIIPPSKKVGSPGTEIDVPLHYKDAMFVRSHFDTMTVRLPDAPKSDEIVVVLAVTDSGRPHARIGGLKKEEAKKEDGLR